MEGCKYITELGTELHMYEDGDVLITDVEGYTIGIHKLDMAKLYTHYTRGELNSFYNKQHEITITVLGIINMPYLKRIGLIDKINQALDYFPELHNKTIYIGVLVKDRNRCFADVDVDNNIIRFNLDYLNNAEKVEGWNATIFHELMHIVQSVSNTPKTEEHCSIHAMARMPNHLVDEDRISYITENGNREHNADICRAAVKYRESGKRGYIKYAKKLLDEVDESKVVLIEGDGDFDIGIGDMK